MKSKLLPVIFFLAFVSSGFLFEKKENQQPVAKKVFSDALMSDEGDDASARYQWEMLRLADPATGKIPAHIRAAELAFAKNLPVMTSMGSSNARLTGNFIARGPWNLGGRSRAIAVDVTNENIVFAGSVNGGLYRSADAGSTWVRVSAINQNPAITWIEQDKRPGHTNTWYYTTGEGYGTSASASGAFYLGNGVYKSADGGLTWTLLASTSSGTPQSFDNVWDIIWKIRCDNTDTVNDVLYASCYGVIYKSINGGTSWVIDRGTGPQSSYFTDVDLTGGGAVYATLSSEGSQRGIWRKDTVNPWADISPPGWDTATFNRVVIGINPSNENEVYFLGETPGYGKRTTNFKGDEEWNSLWRYTYISGNGTGAGGQWQDLSVNIPYPGSQLGNFNSQGGYDLVVRVHPNDPNTVYIGGTNLFRSTTGWTDSVHTTEMGGYDPASTIPFYATYLNHHPDQHNICFLPSNPDIMYQSNDGGVYKTLHDLDSTVVWQSLNNGYVTGQFYALAIDHATANDHIVIGGVQDNGTWFTNNLTLTTPWAQPGFGDGGFCAIDNGHNNYYMSRQEGKTAKVQLDANGNVTGFRRIDPVAGSGYLFINPFILDPNNNEVMYMAAGTKIFRNDSLSQIQMTGAWDTISTGWFQLPDTISYAGAVVSALAVPQSNSSRLYVGTSKRKVYRVDNANTFSPVMTDITSTLFSGTGYVACIAVDPADENKAIVVFSNYSVYSIFYTTDGGVTFAKSAGNLELNQAGTGNAPSIRWVSIVPTANGNVYIAGTSIGIYGTNLLNGLNTVWTNLSPNEIGYMVVDMTDARTSDGYVVAGTHGAGVFSTNITDTLMTGTPPLSDKGFGISVYPNPANELTVIRYRASAQPAAMKIFDSAGRSITEQELLPAQGQAECRLSTGSWLPGIYFIELKSSGKTAVTRLVVQH
jgi:photosystem II stability/assembly factor-like uncharacterized protein